LLEVFGIKAEGNFWFFNYLVSRNSVTEDVVVPSGEFFARG
jgi:hypothetical protein